LLLTLVLSVAMQSSNQVKDASSDTHPVVQATQDNTMDGTLVVKCRRQSVYLM
jgi:hypothetical protein